MNSLILIRHSHTKIEKDISSHEWELSETGFERIEPFSSRLKGYSVGKLFCSKETKCLQTAELLAKCLAVPFKPVKGLEESHRHNLPFFEDAKDFKSKVEKAMAERNSLILGEETLANALSRFSNAVNKVCNDNPELETIAIVSHGTVISLFVEQLTGVDAFNFWSKLKMPDFFVLDGYNFE